MNEGSGIEVGRKDGERENGKKIVKNVESMEINGCNKRERAYEWCDVPIVTVTDQW